MRVHFVAKDQTTFIVNDPARPHTAAPSYLPNYFHVPAGNTIVLLHCFGWIRGWNENGDIWCGLSTRGVTFLWIQRSET